MSMNNGETKPIRFLVAGGRDLSASLLGRADGGPTLETGFAPRASERFGDRVKVEVIIEDSPDLGTLLAALKDASPMAPPVVQRLRTEKFDVFVASLAADLQVTQGAVRTGSARSVVFLEQLLELIRLIKQDFGCHLIFMNASTVDPARHVSNLSKVELEPASLAANRLNLALIRASIEEGISIIDVDRLIAELGAAQHVLGFLDYSAEACDAICNEFLRIVEDYGFFDDRPLLMQVGKSTKS
jgi:hypothetical protein